MGVHRSASRPPTASADPPRPRPRPLPPTAPVPAPAPWRLRRRRPRPRRRHPRLGERRSLGRSEELAGLPPAAAPLSRAGMGTWRAVVVTARRGRGRKGRDRVPRRRRPMEPPVSLPGTRIPSSPPVLLSFSLVGGGFGPLDRSADRGVVWSVMRSCRRTHPRVDWCDSGLVLRCGARPRLHGLAIGTFVWGCLGRRMSPWRNGAVWSGLVWSSLV